MRTVGLQTISNDRTYISPQILTFHRLEHQDYHPFFIKPKTITSLALLLLILNLLARSTFLESLAAYFFFEIPDLKSRGALIGTVFAFICFASIHFPNTLIVRPHPIFWRVILGAFSLYAMLMTYLFLLPLEELQQSLKYFDPKLGQSLPQVLYAEDCRIYTPENPTSSFAPLQMAVFDVHFVAHFLGWFGKMLIMRDWYVAWICSAVFELLELTFRYWLPNFYECWWDSLLLDLFGCNLLGITLGHYFLKYFGVSKINWVKGGKKQDVAVKACDGNLILRLFTKLTPSTLEQYEWAALQDVTRYLGVVVFIITTLVIDCNNFFYKYLAWIPAEHQLVKYRVVLWGLVAVATSKEWYEYVSNPQCHRPGPFVWLSFYVSAIELSSIYKFRGNEFQNPFPWWINLMWTVLAAIFLLGLLKSYKNGRNKVTRQFNPYNPEIDIIKLK